MSGNAGIGRLSEVAADRQREGVDDGRVHRRLPRCGDRFGGSSREPLVAMERDAPVLGCREKRVGEAFPPIGFEKRRRQPGGLVGIPDGAGLAEVAGPENIVLRRAGAIVSDHEARKHAQQGGVPEMPRRQRADVRRRHDGKVLRGSRHPIEERTPHGLRLLLVEALEDHRNLDAAAPDVDLFAPMRIEKRLPVEFEDFGDEAAIGVVGQRLDRRKNPATLVGERVRAQSDARDDAEVPPPPPFSAQKSSGSAQALTILATPSAVTISASMRFAPARP